MRSGTRSGQATVQDHFDALCTLEPSRPDSVPAGLDRSLSSLAVHALADAGEGDHTLERSAAADNRRPTTVSPLANCIGPDALLAKHMLSLADDAQAAQSVELAARFVELALELLDEAYR